MKLMPTSRALSNIASTSFCVKFFPHSPPNCQVPMPTTETRRLVLPSLRYFIVVHCTNVLRSHEGTKERRQHEESWILFVLPSSLCAFVAPRFISVSSASARAFRAGDCCL